MASLLDYLVTHQSPREKERTQTQRPMKGQELREALTKNWWVFNNEATLFENSKIFVQGNSTMIEHVTDDIVHLDKLILLLSTRGYNELIVACSQINLPTRDGIVIATKQTA